MPAYLFVGQTGWGTRRAADLFAGELLARHDPETADRHRRLAAAESHPAIAVVERTGAAISVEEARDIARRAELAPPEGSHQVLVLVDFHLVRNADSETSSKTGAIIWHGRHHGAQKSTKTGIFDSNTTFAKSVAPALMTFDI